VLLTEEDDTLAPLLISTFKLPIADADSAKGNTSEVISVTTIILIIEFLILIVIVSLNNY
jgi:hypothetical protein